MRRFLIPSVIALVIGMVAGCGPKNITPQSVVDDPGVHVSQGKRLLNRSDLTGAQAAFERARGINPEYAPALAALALVAIEREQWETAERLVREAKEKDSRCVDAYVAQIRLLSRQQPGSNWFLMREDWITRVDEEAEDALEVSPNNDEVLYYYGVAQKRALQFDNAGRTFAAAINANGDYQARADEQWKLIQKIQRAAPGTRLGKKVALVDVLNRAELAVLFVDEMRLEEVLNNRAPITYDNPQRELTLTPGDQVQIPADIGGHWAESFLRDAVRLGAVGPKPNGSFEPDAPVTRAEFAYLCQNMIVMITQDQSLLTRFIGEQSQFPDVRADNWAANAISLVASRGIMTGDTITGRFEPDGNITGADALLMIRQLKNTLRLRF